MGRRDRNKMVVVILRTRTLTITIEVRQRGKILEEHEKHIQVSDSLRKPITGSKSKHVVKSTRWVIEPSFISEYKINSITDFGRPIELKVTREIFDRFKCDIIIPRPRRYQIQIENFKPINIFSYVNPPKRYLLPRPIQLKIKVLSYITGSKKYKLRGLFVENKVNANIDKESLMEMIKLGSEAEYKVLSKIDLEDLLLETEKGEGIWFGGSKYVGEPIVFVINDDLWYLIAEICKEYYREARGDLPKPHVIQIEDEEDFEELKTLVELGEKVGKRLIIIRLLKDRNGDGLYISSKEEVSMQFSKIMGRIINELFAQDLGFLILTVDLSLIHI